MAAAQRIQQLDADVNDTLIPLCEADRAQERTDYRHAICNMAARYKLEQSHARPDYTANEPVPGVHMSRRVWPKWRKMLRYRAEAEVSSKAGAIMEGGKRLIVLIACVCKSIQAEVLAGRLLTDAWLAGLPAIDLTEWRNIQSEQIIRETEGYMRAARAEARRRRLRRGPLAIWAIRVRTRACCG
jgi:hypothetical protein